MNALPIDQILPPLLESLCHHAAVVLQAPPGAGKTTRVPLALLNQPWLKNKKIIMLQPRRLAARHAAEFMAAQLGEKAGQTIGYSVRFERCSSRATRIEVVTEGILTRRLQNDPELSDIGLIIFDEFHERNIHSDLALALCRDAQSALREDLKLLVMSATLDAEPVAALLGNCPILTSAGRSFPVATHYLPGRQGESIAEQAAAAIRLALRDSSGDILAFLPGAGEIRRCERLLADLGTVEIRPLFSGLPFKEQQLAMVPGIKRRVILATNIAETSLTIDGISTVVDSGWERRPRFDVGSGITRLELKRISAASATQRQGRAGRLGPGSCYRLWSEGQHAALLPQAPAEIRSADLAPLLLELACWGETAPQRLSWLDPPSPAHLLQARTLLLQLQAIDPSGTITELGKQMVRLPLPPRLACFLIAAQADKQTAFACELAALLSERDILPHSHAPLPGTCDLETRWQLLQQYSSGSGSNPVRRIATELQRILKATSAASWPDDLQMLQRWLLHGWPDRIARQREPGSPRYLLSDGSGAVLSPRSSLHNPPFLIALVLEQQEAQADITLACSIAPELLKEVFASRLQPQRRIGWDAIEGRVIAREVCALGALTLAEKPVKASAEEQVEGALAGVRQIGLERLAWSQAAQQLVARVKYCAQHFPQDNWPDLSVANLMNSLADWLAPFLVGITTRAALERLDPLEALKAMIPWHLLNRLDQLAPERIEVPSGSRIRIDYNGEGPPVLAVKLQELFGLEQSPAIMEGRLPLVIHLLSPAGRPLAVTQDLEHFWNHAYPEVRKEMRGRYPKHPWPEDPWNAPATAKTKKRM